MGQNMKHTTDKKKYDQIHTENNELQNFNNFKLYTNLNNIKNNISKIIQQDGITSKLIQDRSEHSQNRIFIQHNDQIMN